MTLPVTFTTAASGHIADAARWYEQKRKGLGSEFLAEVKRRTSLAATHPLQCPYFHKDIRRIPLKRFPYLIYFRLSADRLLVVAVLHVRRNQASVVP
ncbi:type II toxin-antitoxin system RelE/ParE family toxin [Duganella aceris]|uniref:Type II toxin-antitoxin system RelE/ParE family toxin n=1 Tax=Duganella aceris TaxID=2703883 RepID=A0ABX0FN96_9BURK|nr:type II toxin-antitoxin system RelE/ParE family toxin [Duganella aceris]NGZ86096.1 type II toxin-antitoxin system RelE/ParE family toxin [Duganella aceris]